MSVRLPRFTALSAPVKIARRGLFGRFLPAMLLQRCCTQVPYSSAPPKVPLGGSAAKGLLLFRKRGRALIRRLVAQVLGIQENDPEAERLGGFVISALDGAVILERLDGTPLTTIMLPIFDLLAHYKKTTSNG